MSLHMFFSTGQRKYFSNSDTSQYDFPVGALELRHLQLWVKD